MMNSPSENKPPPAENPPAEKPSALNVFILRNWLSLTGLAIVGESLFAFLLLFALDFFASAGNPYIGVLTYLIVPVVAVAGCGLIGLGLWVGPFRLTRKGFTTTLPRLVIDLSQRRDRSILAIAAGVGSIFLLIIAVGSYHSYHFTESRQFCGQTCHTVMKPEFTTYLRSPHARVACVECHIGPGAAWYVKAKISGLQEVAHVAFNKFHRPTLTPIKNLRPAQETCEQCHWPEAFVGNTDRTYAHFLSDQTNTPYTVRMLMKVGGADPSRGPVGGIHWHMNVGNKIEYVAEDPRYQVIPWVRMTDSQGVVTEFHVPGFKLDPKKHVLHRMDCMDCHNRPSHIYNSPEDAVDLSLSLRRLDPAMPEIRKEAVAVLKQRYATDEEALQKIATTLYGKYSNDPRIRPAIDEVQKIFRENIFPEMKADWRAYPDNIGHKNWSGCCRCHDGEHKTPDGKQAIKTPDGKQAIKANDCKACHVILAQGKGAQLDKLNSQGWEFEHPGGDYGGMACVSCHAANSE